MVAGLPRGPGQDPPQGKEQVRGQQCHGEHLPGQHREVLPVAVLVVVPLGRRSEQDEQRNVKVFAWSPGELLLRPPGGRCAFESSSQGLLRSGRVLYHATGESMTKEPKAIPVTVDLPEEFVRILGAGQGGASLELRKLAAVELVRTGRLAFTKAAELLGMPQADLIECLCAHGVSIFPYDAAELRNELLGSA